MEETSIKIHQIGIAKLDDTEDPNREKDREEDPDPWAEIQPEQHF